MNDTLSLFDKIKVTRRLLIDLADDDTISKPLVTDMLRVVRGLTLEALARAGSKDTL